jgi:hypothetical protein
VNFCVPRKVQSLLRKVQSLLRKVQSLLREGIVSVTEAAVDGHNALSLAICYSRWQTAQWLLEYGEADISILIYGTSVWERMSPIYDGSEAVTALLRVMLLRGDPPTNFTSRFPPEVGLLVQEGIRLRARLPAFLAPRQALLNEHCPLIPPLQALVSDYAEPTTEEVWATGLGVAP